MSRPSYARPIRPPTQSGSIDATVRIYSVGMTKVQGVTARLSSADPGDGPSLLQVSRD